jgi:thiol-disulfide isomerase/thioredoxin
VKTMTYIRLIVGILLFGIVLTGCKQKPVLTDLDGNSIVLEQTHGKWVVINYWSSECGTCVEEIPELNAFYKLHHDTVILLSVNYDQEPPEKLKVITAKLGMHYPTLTTDPAAQLGLPAIIGVPTTFFISPKGEIQPALEGGLTHKVLDQKMGLTESSSPTSKMR